MSLGEKIRMCRKRLGPSTKEMANRLEVTATTISFWENGRVEPTMSSQKRLKDFLILTPNVN
ncbi:helix-turn-helix domain-containing protein [bacterium]|nr:helix-turn-helix domain-containing protein [bacterium]